MKYTIIISILVISILSCTKRKREKEDLMQYKRATKECGTELGSCRTTIKLLKDYIQVLEAKSEFLDLVHGVNTCMISPISRSEVKKIRSQEALVNEIFDDPILEDLRPDLKDMLNVTDMDFLKQYEEIQVSDDPYIMLSEGDGLNEFNMMYRMIDSTLDERLMNLKEQYRAHLSRPQQTP